MYQLIQQSMYDFYKAYKKYIVFSLFYTILTSLIFVPAISFVFNRMLLLLGSGSLLNGDVYKIALSPAGMIGMLIISFISVVVLFIQFGVMIIIAQQAYFSKEVYASEALMTTIKEIPKLLGFGSIFLILLLGLFIPFIDVSPIPALLDFNLAIYLTNLFYKFSNWKLSIYLVVLLLAVFLFFRFIFTLHFIIIEDRKLGDALKRSWMLAKKNKVKMILVIFVLNFLFFLFGFTIIRFLSLIPKISGANFLGDLINNYLVTFSSFITLIYTILFIPLNLIIITRLFFLLKEKYGEEIKDELNIQRSIHLIIFERAANDFFNKRRYALALTVFVYITLIFLINYTVNEQSDYLKWNVQVAAHRGDIHRAPENTITSIRSAIEMGVDAVEVDVMLTKDEIVVLHHDYSLKRMAKQPFEVAKLTYEELSKFYVEKLIDGILVREKIPTLNEVLLELKDENITIIIDIKIPDSRKNEVIAEQIVDLVNEYELKDRVYVQSFDYNVLQEVRQRDSEMKIGQILFVYAGNLRNLDVDFYTVRQTMLSERLVRNARNLDREVWVWTVNIDRNINEVLKYDIHGIITDYPERVPRR